MGTFDPPRPATKRASLDRPVSEPSKASSASEPSSRSASSPPSASNSSKAPPRRQTIEVQMNWLESEEAAVKVKVPPPPRTMTMEVQMDWLEFDADEAPAAVATSTRKRPPRLPGARRTIPAMPATSTSRASRPPASLAASGKRASAPPSVNAREPKRESSRPRPAVSPRAPMKRPIPREE